MSTQRSLPFAEHEDALEQTGLQSQGREALVAILDAGALRSYTPPFSEGTSGTTLSESQRIQ